ncbi:phage integrase SAM-like domain-containing protein [Chryseobacterium sp. KMC2]|uniref:phage integrase SAM-like domain-containing protein n=1 Tax=Chryseobacterium sp. KMC2 TaxID=2800705 RepID=UPI00192430D4|nr:phage integrase SAM-like domain-containing protein [Chryseobacterium sp. KMC2]MBL3547238.1 phage integrase SAM-like domain-containing protein [Chryseobacterium sp. KMC2]
MSKVTLRKKPISGNRQSLYLEIYPPIYNPDTGIMQRKQYLKLYIYNRPKNETEKDLNKETLALAEYVRAQRQIELQSKRFDFTSDAKMKSNFLDFFRDEAAKRGNCFNWVMSVRYFISFAGSNVPHIELNETLCEEYADYLLSCPSIGRKKKGIKKNTAVAYYSRFRLTLKEAFKKHFLPTDLGSIIESIKPQETHRPFLFLEELEILALADCPNPIVKKAGLFSAMTGFRYSDIEKLLWNEIHGTEGNYYIIYNQEKTESAEYYPVSDQVI